MAIDPQARREALRRIAKGALAAAAPSLGHAAAPLSRPIPSTGERVAAIGLGTWMTFDLAPGDPARAARGEILGEFLAAGGRLVDSSPMYGHSEEVVGEQARRIAAGQRLFAATKVWTFGALAGRRQIENSRRLWGVERFDLLQVHNLLDWETQLATLQAMKAEGKVRLVGVTTSHGRRHDLVEAVMRREAIDTVQFTYNIAERQAEARLLPAAAERGLAVIVNRPFDGGELFARVGGRRLPGWSAEIGCRSWAEVFLKFVVSHPAVTAAIPATSQVAHLRENMLALAEPFPDAALRRRMAADFDRL